MSGSTYGNIFKLSSWGESHGKALGVVVDGCPAGVPLCESDIQVFLDRRKPGQSRFATKRSEDDSVDILSGVFEGKTTGAPLSMIVRNTSQRSGDYTEIASYYRPGHADYTFDEKYGFRDYRGGGRSSGRETIARVAAGAIASKILQALGVKITTYTKSIGGIEIDYNNFDAGQIMCNPLYMPDSDAASNAALYLKELMAKKDSAGGIIECVVDGLPTGVGEPVFEKLDANLAKAVMSIGAVKGFEIGEGFLAASMSGLDNNDAFITEAGTITKATNHSGGVLGGISDGSQLVLRAAIKPTPSVAATQNTVNVSHENIQVSIKGRHDPVIVPRAVVVVESMVAVTLVDMIFMSMTSKIDDIVRFFNK